MSHKAARPTILGHHLMRTATLVICFSVMMMDMKLIHSAQWKEKKTEENQT
jgi:hypothetical protein